MATPQTLPQQISEKPVITVPTPHVVQRQQEEIPFSQLFQRLAAVITVGQGVAQRTAELIED